MTKKLLIRKTIIAIFTTTILLTTIPTTYGAAVQTPIIKVDGQVVIFPDAVPFVDSNDRTMVPVRFVAETLGAEVSWESTRQLVTIVKDTTRIALRIGENSAVVNTPTSDARKEFDTVSVLKESRTFVPLRFISETFGAGVAWDGVNNTVIINSDGTVATVECTGCCTGECKPVVEQTTETADPEKVVPQDPKATKLLSILPEDAEHRLSFGYDISTRTTKIDYFGTVLGPTDLTQPRLMQIVTNPNSVDGCSSIRIFTHNEFTWGITKLVLETMSPKYADTVYKMAETAYVDKVSTFNKPMGEGWYLTAAYSGGDIIVGAQQYK